MRVLTEEELESVFGGDSQTAVRLAPTVVNATVVANPSYTFSIGSAFVPTGYGEAGVACYWNGVPGAISHLPSSDHIRCLLSHSADPSYDIAPGYQLNISNNYAFVDPNRPHPVDSLRLDVKHTIPAGMVELGGMTQGPRDGAPYAAVTLFAGALIAHPEGGQYIELETGQTKTIPALTQYETTIFVAAHEAAHTQGISSADEMVANGFGMHAVLRYRTLNPNTVCPGGA